MAEGVTSKSGSDQISVELSSRRTGMSFQRTRMSADRTLMSVIRTALSLIGFGFTIYQVFQKLLEAQVLQLQNTVPVNYAGNPALAVPVPLRGAGFALTSLQLIGPPRSEGELLAAGRLVENAVRPSPRGSSYKRLANACPVGEAILRQ